MRFLVSATTAAVLYFLALISAFSRSGHVTTLAGSDVAVNDTPTVLAGSVLPRDVRCARVTVSGLSRLILGSYYSGHRITLVPSYEIHEKLYKFFKLPKKNQICLHSNTSLGLCQCENDQWENIPSGIWNYVVSPDEEKYIDVKFVENFSGSVSVTPKLEFHKLRLLCLAIGFVLLLSAPIISSWVPFDHIRSMAIGICLETILFKVLLSLLVGIDLGGPDFGWVVRKFVVAEDVSVDVVVAQFVKWGYRVVGATFIFQSIFDTTLATAMFFSFSAIYLLIISSMWDNLGCESPTSGESLQRSAPVEGPSSVRRHPTNPSSTEKSTWQFLAEFSYWAINNRVRIGKALAERDSPEFSHWVKNNRVRIEQAFTEWASPEFSDWVMNNRGQIWQALVVWASSPAFSDWMTENDGRIWRALVEWTSSPEFTNWKMNKGGRIKSIITLEENVVQ